MNDQKPSIGRIVHYQAYGTPGGEYPSVPRAAVITEVFKPGPSEAAEPTMVVGLCVLNPAGVYFNRCVPFSETPKPGCWSWPPRV
jgi:hypothetical protein